MAAFVKGTGLRPAEATFFGLLVQLDQAKHDDARNTAWEQISATRRFREARHIDHDAFEYLSSWALPVVRELAHRSDFRDDPAWIADQLRPRIPVAEARRALEVLQRLGLLVDQEGTLVPTEASVATAPEISRLAVANYYQGVMQRSAEAIERFAGTERHLISVTVGVPDSLLPILKAEANAFLERMMHLCDASIEDPDRIMQMNLQFTVAFDDEERSITIVADDFDLAVPSEFVVTRAGEVVLEFGDEAWLTEVAALAPTGETRLGKDHPALTRAFFAGLWHGSRVLSFE